MLLLLTACVYDSVSGLGELGRLQYMLTADTQFAEGDLTEIGLGVGYTHEISIFVTPRGQKLLHDNAESLVQSVDPDDGVVLEQEQRDDDDDGRDDAYAAEDVSLTVTEPGVHTLTATWNDSLFDRIDLDFRVPTTLELIGFVRAPWSEEFVKVEEPTLQVEKGTQYAWITVSQDASGERLAGEVTPELDAEPLDAVVPGMDVSSINEDGIQNHIAPSLYFIESGAVTVTLTDPINGIVATQAFDVVD